MTDIMDILFGPKGDRGVLGNWISGNGAQSELKVVDLPPYLQNEVNADQARRNGTNPPPPIDTVTWQQAAVGELNAYDPLIMKGLGLAAIGGLAYLLYLEAQGKQTVLSKTINGPTGTEFTKGTLDFLSNVAKASVSSPGLRILAAYVVTELMKKAKLTSEAASKSIMIGIAALEGIEVTGDLISGFMPTFGAKKSEGPTTLAFTDARTTYYAMPDQFGGAPVLDQPRQLSMNPLIEKAIAAVSKKERAALMS